MTEQIKIRRHVTLLASDVEWLDTSYGPDNLSWVLTALLSKFRQAHKTTPLRLAELASEALKYEIEDSLDEGENGN